MNCPYCAEEIKEAAKFCPHCRHDIALLKSEQARVSELSREVEKLKTGVYRDEKVAALIEEREELKRAKLEAERAKLEAEPLVKRWSSETTKRWAITIAVLLAVIIPVLAEGIAIFLINGDLAKQINPDSFPQLGFNLLLALLSFLNWFLPLPLGFWVSLSWPARHSADGHPADRHPAGRHWAGYILLGSLVGVLQTLLAIPTLQSVDRLLPDWEWPPADINVPVFVAGFFLVSAFIFMLGGFLGDEAKLRVFDPEAWPKPSGWPGGVAALIAKTGIASTRRLVPLVRWLSAIFRSATGVVILTIIGFTADSLGVLDKLMKVPWFARLSHWFVHLFS